MRMIPSIREHIVTILIEDETNFVDCTDLIDSLDLTLTEMKSLGNELIGAPFNGATKDVVKQKLIKAIRGESRQ